jgi:hypothetical protein
MMEDGRSSAARKLDFRVKMAPSSAFVFRKDCCRPPSFCLLVSHASLLGYATYEWQQEMDGNFLELLERALDSRGARKSTPEFSSKEKV